MNDSSETLNLGDDVGRWLDRLADGELNSDQQRQLLAALETQPDGWRRCALAFVEAQTLHGELRQMAVPAQPMSQQSGGGEQSVITTRLVHRRRSASRALRWLAIAAGLILAFTLGNATRSLWLPAAAPEVQKSGNIAAAPLEKSTDAQRVETVAKTENQTSDSSVAATTANKWQALKVTIPTADGQAEQTVEVPLVSADEQQVKLMLAKQEPVLSDVALQALQRAGHEVEQHRAYYPVQLADGTQVVLPMDFVEVRDTGSWQ